VIRHKAPLLNPVDRDTLIRRLPQSDFVNYREARSLLDPPIQAKLCQEMAGQTAAPKDRSTWLREMVTATEGMSAEQRTAFWAQAPVDLFDGAAWLRRRLPPELHVSY